MKRLSVIVVAIVIILSAAYTGSGGAIAQDDAEPTIEALKTRVSELKGTAEARGEKINEQRTQIAELQGQVPPTATAVPDVSGKEAYPYVGDPLDVFTRPFNYYGHKMSFCGTVYFIEVAPPGRMLRAGDENPREFDTISQVFLDGFDVQYMLGFNGDTTGINEDSYVCVWGTLFDTSTGTNTFGGSIINPLFDAEFFELA